MRHTERNKLAVLFTLALSQSPLSIPDLAKRTGKSYNTIKKVVTEEVQVVAVPGKPTRYHLAMPEQLQGRVIRVTDEPPTEGWVRWLERVRPKLAELTALDKTRQLNEVNNQGIILEALGVNLASLGYALQENSDQPDWFTKIGGDENAGVDGIS